MNGKFGGRQCKIVTKPAFGNGDIAEATMESCRMVDEPSSTLAILGRPIHAHGGEWLAGIV
jgi:hypothetical protein